ncbi:MAG: hypothetical protein HRT99_01480, partial [Mycoplasmatales bacterium]|nr:hypothetical protein [Mycoplasmatales bacterium]
NWKQIFERYFAWEAINNKYLEGLIFIPYSSLIFSDENSIRDILIKLNKVQYNLNSIVWIISYDDIIKYQKEDVITNLSERGFKIGLTKTLDNSLLKIKKLKPSYIITSINDIELTKKSSSIPTIVTDISDDDLYKLAIDKNAQIIVSKNILSKRNVENYDKKSKIYLKEKSKIYLKEKSKIKEKKEV